MIDNADDAADDAEAHRRAGPETRAARVDDVA
jgi:hypothetical protein